MGHKGKEKKSEDYNACIVKHDKSFVFDYNFIKFLVYFVSFLVIKLTSLPNLARNIFPVEN